MKLLILYKDSLTGVSQNIIDDKLRKCGLTTTDYAVKKSGNANMADANLVLLLGNELHHDSRTVEPLKYTKATKKEPPKPKYPYSIYNYRGTLYTGITPQYAGVKLLATHDPNVLMTQYDLLPLFRFDLQRAAEECTTKELNLPQRMLLTHLSLGQILELLEPIKRNKVPLALDIEGGINTMSCLSIACDIDKAFIIPFTNWDGSSYWNESDEIMLWEALRGVLTDAAIPKVLQNCLYDNFVLIYAYHCPIRGITNDTMLKHWELYSELEKSLAVQTSIYTKEPYYKHERKNGNQKTFWEYCCKDSCVTYEINDKLEQALPHAARLHYNINMDLLKPIMYMEVRGLRYDIAKGVERVKELEAKLSVKQNALNTLVGREIKVRGTKFTEFLYNEYGLPVQYHRKTGEPTSNYEALLKLFKKTNDPILGLAIPIRSLLTRIQMLSISCDADGRMRCGYNVVGTETGRLTCYTSPTGSGYNLQTIPEGDRDLFLADVDHHMFQCDLSGADGWTVAAHCASLGDHTMLDDLNAGIKIAKVIAGMFLWGADISRLPREELLKRTAMVPKTDPIYFGSKCCQHGSNYGMGKNLLSATIFIQSEGEVNIGADVAQKLQDYYFHRYPGVKRWHNWVQQQLIVKGSMTSASGHVRHFFGRRNDHGTLKQALSNEPQENTTYATNIAALRLWNDKDNRRQDVLLRVEPLHQVHDALVGQFNIKDTDYALRSIQRWFDNPLVIAGRTLTIPFEGRYGSSWGTLEHKI